MERVKTKAITNQDMHDTLDILKAWAACAGALIINHYADITAALRLILLVVTLSYTCFKFYKDYVTFRANRKNKTP